MNTLARTNETLCPIWCRLYNLKNAKNTNAKVILLVKLKAKASWVFFKIFKLHKCYQMVQSITCFFNPLVPGLSYGIDTGTNIKPIFFETILYTFLQTTKKINKQAEIGQKLNNLPNNHPTSKKSYSNIFFQSYFNYLHISVVPQGELNFWKCCPSLLSGARNKHRKHSHESFYKVPYGAKRKFTIDKMLVLPEVFITSSRLWKKAREKFQIQNIFIISEPENKGFN